MAPVFLFKIPLEILAPVCYNINKIREAETPRKTAERKEKNDY